MKLTLEGVKDRRGWEEAGIALPSYDPAAISENTKKAPVWVHFGIGNIFRIFLGGIADKLIEEGLTDKGITCVESFDFDVVDKIYDPYDNLVLSVTLYGDGRRDQKVLGSLSEAISLAPDKRSSWERLRVIFTDPGLQMVSFTITEKGYALKNEAGVYFPFVEKDIEAGPEGVLSSAVSIVTAMLYARFSTNGAPISLVSMDNVSRNGEKLRNAVLLIAEEWQKKGFVQEDFLQYVENEERVAFPWTMIDKITPRPDDTVAKDLKDLGIEGMEPVITSKKTYIAAFVNAEAPQYLVIEDSFPNGRPPLEKAGVYMTDRDTVNKSERMKVTVCLNPLHTAMAPYGCVLGYKLISDVMKDPDILKLLHYVGELEGMEVVKDPGIISPQAFLTELLTDRFPNPYLPDTPQRIVVDASQMVAIRYGETTKAFCEKYGDAKRLKGIPMAIAGWLRYLLAVDDDFKPFELSPDPMLETLTEMLKTIEPGKPETLTDQLKPILSNANIFGLDLYEAGIGEEIEELFREEIASPGAVRKTLQKLS